MSARYHQYSSLGNMFPVLVIMASCVGLLVYIGVITGMVFGTDNVTWANVEREEFTLDKRPVYDLAGWFQNFTTKDPDTLKQAHGKKAYRTFKAHPGSDKAGPEDQKFVWSGGAILAKPVPHFWEHISTTHMHYRPPHTRVNPRSYGVYHKGIDTFDPVGTKVWASIGGKVTYSGYDGGYGNSIIVVSQEKGKTIECRYSHLSSRKVAKGETVTRGQVIALMGSTGHSTGSHLDYKVRVDGHWVDPLSMTER